MTNKSLVQGVEKALLIIAGSRFINKGKKLSDLTPLDIENETGRIERIFEKWWVENDNDNDYYQSFIKWISLNQKDLLDPNKFNNDYTSNVKDVSEYLKK